MKSDATWKKMLAETRRVARKLPMRNPYVSYNIFKRWIVWKRLQIILEMVQKQNGREAVLDFGTGVGVLLPSLSKLFKEVYGIDVDHKSIELAHNMIKKLDAKNVYLECVKTGSELSIFKSKTFHCIVVADVLEHIPHAGNILSEFRRVLRKDGLLIISLPTESLLYYLLSSKTSGHVHSLDELSSMIKEKFLIKRSSNLYGFFKILACAKN